MYIVLYLVCGIIAALVALKIELAGSKYKSAEDICQPTLGFTGLFIILTWPIVVVLALCVGAAILIGAVGAKIAVLMLPPIHKVQEKSPYRD